MPRRRHGLAWSGAALAAVLVVLVCWPGGGHGDREHRADTEREIGRGAAWIVALSPPSGFTPVACELPNSDADRCWRLTGSPADALDALAPLVVSGGFGRLARTCDDGTTLEPEPTECRADARVLLIFATRDLEPSPGGADAQLGSTTTVHLGTVHLGD